MDMFCNIVGAGKSFTCPKTFSLFGAISEHGLEGYSTHLENGTSHLVKSFLKNLIYSMQSKYPNKTIVLLMDGANVNVGKVTLEMLLNIDGVRTIVLPAYSPQLAPIEHLWGIVKRKIMNFGVKKVKPKKVIQTVEDSEDKIQECFKKIMKFIVKSLSKKPF